MSGCTTIDPIDLSTLGPKKIVQKHRNWNQDLWARKAHWAEWRYTNPDPHPPTISEHSGLVPEIPNTNMVYVWCLLWEIPGPSQVLLTWVASIVCSKLTDCLVLHHLGGGEPKHNGFTKRAKLHTHWNNSQAQTKLANVDGTGLIHWLPTIDQ